MKPLLFFLFVSTSALAQQDVAKRLQVADSTLAVLLSERKTDSLRKAAIIAKLDKWITELGKDSPEVEAVLRSLKVSMMINRHYEFSLKVSDMAQQMIDSYLSNQGLPDAIIKQYFPSHK